ncbi:MAG TPA: DNA-binding transcriptional regulator OxyR [Gammaproteobacteria bacterium]
MPLPFNLRDLEYLVLLDEERHFRRAAERGFVSQPTLSGQLKKLEEQLGVVLVERTSRQVTMTEAGRAVAAQARRVLAEAKAIRDVAQAFQDPLAGELHLGLIPTIAPYLLPLCMPLIRARHPQLRLMLHEQQTAPALEQLRNATLDLLLLALPVETDEFAELELYTEPFLLAAPQNDPLAHKQQATLADLQGRSVLLLEEGHCLRGQALDVCFTAGASEYAGFHATSLETLRHMVGEGIGITLIPELAVPQQRSASDPIRYLPFADPPPSRRIGLLWRRGSYRESAFRAIAATVRDAVAQWRASR